MATPFFLTDAATFVDGGDFTAYSNKVELSAEADELDSTNFASGGWHERIGGLKTSSVNVEGFFQAGDAGKPDDVSWTDLGTAVAVSVCPVNGGTAGNLAYLTRAVDLSYNALGEVGQLAPFTLNASGDRALVRGQVAHPSGTARTTTSTGTIINLGAVSATQSLYANLHVTAASGSTPTLVVKVQSAALVGFGSPTDRITFTSANSISSQHSSVAGAITDAFWRVTWTIGGSSPSFTFLATFGIA